MPVVGRSANQPSGGGTRAMRECIASTMPVTPFTPSITSRALPRKSASAPVRCFETFVKFLLLFLAARDHLGDGRRGTVRRALLGRRVVLLRFLRHLVAALVAFGHGVLRR